MAHISLYTCLQKSKLSLWTKSRITQSLKSQISHIKPALVIVTLMVAFTCIGILALSYIFDSELDVFTRDIVATAHLPNYTGVLSTLGIIGWGATVTICFLGYFLFQSRPYARKFMLGSALISFVLLLDDMLLLHENVMPDIIPYGEKVTYILYGLLILFYLWLFLEEILKSYYLLFFGALIFLGISIVIDVALPFLPEITFVEDVFKFTGITLWLTYFFVLIKNRVQMVTTPEASPEESTIPEG